MEARNDDPRVRPIPIDDDISSEFGSAAPTERTDHGPSKRPWLPLTLAAVAVAMVLGSVASFGALQEQDPPPPDAAFVRDAAAEEELEVFSPPTTVAASLQETVPGVTDRLTLIANEANGPVALLWDPSFIQPKPFPIELDPAAPDASMTLRSATFDAGGDFVAVSGIPDGEESEVLRVGTPTDISAIELVDATSFVWHATDVAHLSWVQPNAAGIPALFTARVNPLSKLLMDEREIAPVDAAATLVRWDDAGFVINTGAGEIVALTIDGGEVWRSEGEALTASASTILTTTTGSDHLRLSTVTALDRVGVELGSVLDESVDEDVITRTVAMSGNTGLIARIDVRQDRTRIELNGSSFAGTRIIQYNDDVEPIGFTSNDKFLVFRADGSNDLVFVNWSLGSFHILSVPDQFGIVGLDLG